MRNAYPWILVAAGGLIGCVAIGSMFALPVLLQPMAQATGWSRTGHLERHDLRLFGDGICQFRLGRAGRQVWSASRRGLRGRAHLRRPGAGGARLDACRVPDRLWPGARRWRRRRFRAADGDRRRLVRRASRSRRLAGLGRNGHGADDHVAARCVAGQLARLAYGVDGDRHDRFRDHGAGAGAHPAAPARRAEARRAG